MTAKNMKAHPDAEIFPMMEPEELENLANDIKENGLRFPIVTGDHEGKTVIVDGRNRMKACEIAGVEPSFAQLNGHDPKAFILSVNINRRHMTAGQRAMATAMIYPDPEQRGRGNKRSKDLEPKSFSSARLSQARTVLAYSRPLAEQVLAGSAFLDKAYEEAKTKQREKRDIEEYRETLKKEAPDLLALVADERITVREALDRLETRKAESEQLDTIRADAPDLVALVEEERMSVQDALAAHEKRQEIARAESEAATRLLADVLRLFDAREVKPAEEAKRLMEKFNPDLWPAEELGQPTAEFFQAAADMLLSCAKIRKQQEKRQ